MEIRKLTSREYYKMMAEQRPEGRSYLTNVEAYQLLLNRKVEDANVAKALHAIELALHELNRNTDSHFTLVMLLTNIRYYVSHAKSWLDGTWPLEK